MTNPKQNSILIIDDTPTNIKVLFDLLQKSGFRVLAANSGETALIVAQKTLPDLILLDVMMSGIDGFETCRRLKENPQTHPIPVIFLSALNEAMDKIRAFSVGGADYITKPFQMQEVLARVENQLALQAAKTEICKLNFELEQRVQQRTEQLAIANQELEQEIAERKKVEQALAEEKDHLVEAQQVAHVGSWEFNLLTQKLSWSDETYRIFGLLGQELPLTYEYFRQLIYVQDRDLWGKTIRGAIEQGNPYEIELRIVRPNQEIRWIFAKGRTIFNSKGEVARLFGTLLDITDRKLAEERLLYNALHDALTNLPNRSLLMERLELSLKRAKRAAKFPYEEYNETHQIDKGYLFAVLFIDLDRFKVVNDSLGHQLGDQLLVAIAAQIEKVVRSTDTVARLGGDEFVIILDPIENINDAIRVAERIFLKLKSPFHLESRQVFTTASIGIAVSSVDYEHGSDLLRDADIAMFRAKKKGKARYEVFNQVMYAQALKQLQLENDLRQALERQEFQVYYQPIVSLSKGRLAGFEALVRWQHPQRGLISPGEFIPIAEETGLIVPIGEWVLRSACQQMYAWQTKFPTANLLKVSVNLSLKQLTETDFLDKLDKILLQTGLEGQSLQLELTESMLVDNVEQLIIILQQLRTRAIQLSIDDFGTGYSSLSCLHRFPTNNLKIDRSFVSDIGENGESMAIVETILTLAHQLGMKATAEGIETQHQLRQLQALSCEEAQGFLFSEPLEQESAEALIVANICS